MATTHAALLRFDVANKRLALPVEAVVETTLAVLISAVPDGPPILEGVINYRGSIIPVLDIRARLRLPPAELDPAQHFIIARTKTRLVALRVDRAIDLLQVDRSAVEPGETAAPGARLVAGVARLHDGVVVIHDLDTFLAADEETEIEAALTRAPPTVQA